MNELVESEQELNAADVDEDLPEDEEDEAWEANFFNDANQKSFFDSDQEQEILRKRKEKEVKINNSFSGPYPIDPTDFNHTDKGPNFQFLHL